MVIYLLLPPPTLDRVRSASVLVLAADGSILRGFLTADGKWRLPIEPENVDPLYRRMVIAEARPEPLVARLLEYEPPLIDKWPS